MPKRTILDITALARHLGISEEKVLGQLQVICETDLEQAAKHYWLKADIGSSAELQASLGRVACHFLKREDVFLDMSG